MRLTQIKVNAARTRLATLRKSNSMSLKVIRLDPRQGVLLGVAGDDEGVGGQWDLLWCGRQICPTRPIVLSSSLRLLDWLYERTPL